MHCQATVIRVSSDNSGDVKVAFKINYMKFQNYGGGVANFPGDLTLMRQPN